MRGRCQPCPVAQHIFPLLPVFPVFSFCPIFAFPRVFFGLSRETELMEQIYIKRECISLAYLTWSAKPTKGHLTLGRPRILSTRLLFCSPNPALKAWRVPGEPLVFSLYWKPEEAGSETSKGKLWWQRRSSEGVQTSRQKPKLPLQPSNLGSHHPVSPHSGRGFPLEII